MNCWSMEGRLWRSSEKDRLRVLASIFRPKRTSVSDTKLISSGKLGESDWKPAYQFLNDLYDAVKLVGG